MTAVRRVGILGGTFDPVHSGHLMIAERALAELGLDQVLFVTAGSPRLKRQAPSAASEHRLEMVRLAVEHDGRFAVSDAEIHRHGPTYTVDTLEHVLREYGSGDELYFILGVDVLPRFHEWRNSERILELCRLVVVSRPGYSAFDWDDFYVRNPMARDRVTVVSSAADISGTELRQRVAAELTLKGLVPEVVEEYILRHGLYRSDDRGDATETAGDGESRTTVKRLLNLALARGAIKYGEFTLTSGKRSGYYFDGRLLSLDPEGAYLIGQAILPILQDAGAEAVGGTTLGADPIVTAVAVASHETGPAVPAFIVRKESKEHGTRQNIEGPLVAGARVAIVDDVCTTGGSLFHAIAAAEEAGCTVVKVLAVLDRREGGSEEMRRRGYDFVSLLQATADGTIEAAPAS
jgi:nicotinate (nicotinamide) nucleotide adenylyltransferase